MWLALGGWGGGEQGECLPSLLGSALLVLEGWRASREAWSSSLALAPGEEGLSCPWVKREQLDQMCFAKEGLDGGSFLWHSAEGRGVGCLAYPGSPTNGGEAGKSVAGHDPQFSQHC